MKLALLTVGRPSAAYARQGMEFFAERLKPFGGCEVMAVKAQTAGPKADPGRVMAAEGERILARLNKRDALWALDLKGRAWSSRRWAKELDAARLAAPGRLVLVIGGHLGLDGAVLQRARARVSLGPATLAHELAAVVALEQLYRANSILAGLPYHR